MYITKFKQNLNKAFRKTNKVRDKLIYQIEKLSKQKDYFNIQKEKYLNNTLNDMVKLNNKFNKVIVIDQHLVPIIDPVFRDAKGFRSHFYAASKRIVHYILMYSRKW